MIRHLNLRYYLYKSEIFLIKAKRKSINIRSINVKPVIKQALEKAGHYQGSQSSVTTFVIARGTKIVT